MIPLPPDLPPPFASPALQARHEALPPEQRARTPIAWPRYRHATRRPWQPLTTLQFAAIRRFFENTGAGRPMHDLRGRLDAIFWVACHNGPWRLLPAEMGPAEAAQRQFRRWVHKGVWERLLLAVSAADAPPMLKWLEHWVCRAWRRCLRILDLPGLRLAQRLGLASALPGPWWMLPKPDLSEAWLPLMLAMLKHARTLPPREWKPWLAAARWMHGFLGGASRLPRGVAPA